MEKLVLLGRAERYLRLLNPGPHLLSVDHQILNDPLRHRRPGQSFDLPAEKRAGFRPVREDRAGNLGHRLRHGLTAPAGSFPAKSSAGLNGPCKHRYLMIKRLFLILIVVGALMLVLASTITHAQGSFGGLDPTGRSGEEPFPELKQLPPIPEPPELLPPLPPLPEKPMNLFIVYGVVAGVVLMGGLLFFLARRNNTKSSS